MTMKKKIANTYIFAVDLRPKWCSFLEDDVIKGLFLFCFFVKVILQITNIMKSHTLLNKRCQKEPAVP